ncbi:glycosyltransferase family 2 protein [Luteimonas salinilitoris]|uniref:Glycosyltransferase family 2 protein n=1 Tax=Luteimonas salinilitoris TaxID=3237697 RepID=A0ABV4HQD6_9GAMM
MAIEIVSVICARNEARYLEVLVPYLEGQNINVVLIDNGSEDGSRDLFTPARHPNIVRRIDLPYEGSFDLTAQLHAKRCAMRETQAEWVIHQDADEILHGPDGWGRLRECIEAAHTQGFNVMNFNELVMLPADPDVDDIFANNKNYYFYEPRPLRLMRAWKRSANLENIGSGGHVLSGADVYVSPVRMILKHFMVRSRVHALKKYMSRTYSRGDREKGWHGKRMNLSAEQLNIPTSAPGLHRLKSVFDAPSALPAAVRTHFWDWQPS